MEIVAAQTSDVTSAAGCLADAFAGDPHMTFFFEGDPALRLELVTEFFSILMVARLALGMPVLVLKSEGRILGSAMGYDTQRPEWLPDHRERWASLQQRQELMVSRFAKSQTISEKYEPSVPHFYLGVLGVHPSIQGKGAGLALIEAYCDLSERDPVSAGTFLETAERKNLGFYQRCGFRLLGQGELEFKKPLWCLYRSKNVRGVS
ncbi:MAG: N-acetyltransferase [Mesorhizobium sp.]|uniref:GNAT family N-acetyltransferase n=1 Tax=Mesorhizobium sp. TaxID=1871066 RepID=UPI000FE6A586|nr:GNAT family N-acetyltransferase [Mesorhizobium sp.]RWM96327.1 MAG: N-acetyltransferase [Mesorhizobium sp.]